MNKTDIREHMPVVSSDQGEFGTVDCVEGDAIKLTKGQDGKHHWIPTSWVTKVDEKVYIDRPGSQVMHEWFDSPPEGAKF